MICRLCWNARKEEHHETRRMTVDWAHSKSISRPSSDCEYDGHRHHEYDIDHSQPSAAHNVKHPSHENLLDTETVSVCFCLPYSLFSLSFSSSFALSYFCFGYTHHTCMAFPHQAHHTLFPARDVGENKDCPLQSRADDKNLLHLLWISPDLCTHVRKMSMLSSSSVGQAEWSCNSPAQGIWVSG